MTMFVLHMKMFVLIYDKSCLQHDNVYLVCVAMLQPPTCPNARQCGINRGESAPEVTVERRLVLREHDRQEQDARGEAALHGLPPARGQTKFVCKIAPILSALGLPLPSLEKVCLHFRQTLSSGRHFFVCICRQTLSA